MIFKKLRKKFVLSIIAMFIIINGANAEEDILKGFKPYFSVQGGAFYYNKSEELGANAEEENDMFYALFDAVMGFEYEKDNFKSTFELVLSDQNLVEIGLAFVKYNIDDSTQFMFGLNDSPYTFNSSEVSFEGSNLIGFGTTTEDTGILQTQLSFNGFAVTLLQPNLPINDTGENEISGSIIADYESIVPKVVIGYNYKSNFFELGLGGAYNTFKINDSSSQIDGDFIKSYLVYVNAIVKSGKFYFMGNFGYAVNPLEFGLVQAVASELVVCGDEIKETTTLEGYVEAGYSFGDISLNAGIGYVQADNDTFIEKDSALAYYVQLPVSVNDYITVVPEVSVHDFLKDNSNVEEGHEMQVGIFVEAAY